jgi:hypothetical protein
MLSGEAFMTMIEEPAKQLSYIQQSLSSNKKPLGLFLGAGCPMSIQMESRVNSPLIPDIVGITKIVCDNLAKDKDCKLLIKIIEDHFDKDGRENPTLEEMLTHIRALRAVVGKDEIRGFSAKSLDQLDDQSASLFIKSSTKRCPIR